MARPSMAEARRKQIIRATLLTIATHGISGTTLDRIADTACMSRGHVRHFVGNRERLLLDAARVFYADEEGSPGIIPATVTHLDAALDYLFGDEFTSTGSENAIVLAFVELARSSTEIAAVLTQAYAHAKDQLAELIAAAIPQSNAAARENVAQGVLAIALGNVFLGDFDRDNAHTARTRQAALRLLSTLE